MLFSKKEIFMQKEKVKVHVVIEDFDEKGRRFFREEDRIEEFTILHEDRHHIFCRRCFNHTYPECLRYCSVGWNTDIEALISERQKLNITTNKSSE